jgi:hypothetical protein
MNDLQLGVEVLFHGEVGFSVQKRSSGLVESQLLWTCA